MFELKKLIIETFFSLFFLLKRIFNTFATFDTKLNFTLYIIILYSKIISEEVVFSLAFFQKYSCIL